MEPNKVSYESMLEGREIALTQHEDVYSESIKAVCHFSMFNNTTYMSCESKDRIRQQYYTVGFSIPYEETQTQKHTFYAISCLFWGSLTTVLKMAQPDSRTKMNGFTKMFFALGSVLVFT